MAKRLGNVSNVEGLREAGVTGAAYRHVVFSTHYRKELNLSADALEASLTAVRRVGEFAARLHEATGGTPALVEIAAEAERDFRAALADDLNAPEAMAALFVFLKRVNAELDRHGDDAAGLAEAGRVFALMDGVLDLVPEAAADDGELAGWVEERLAARKAARSRRDFAAADAVRDELAGRGVEIKDTPQGTSWRRR